MANYKVSVAASAVKELRGVPKRDRHRIAFRMQSLSGDPRPPGCEKLSGENRYRIRQGDYRILYSIDDSTEAVDIVKIGHRREVYR
ncbi:MAG TPA: type II toxin-antitoxin system RelE/ParE family toxin [Terriglobia bacterium]|nr:type II toxin-antitoxin system RelE/ParE family toxin [Terriglobia bacterium]